MVAFLYYPFYLIVFWYWDVLFGLVNFFGRFNRYLISLLSLNLLINTFFKPLKNEYRQGLVMFSILFGIAIKTILISVLVAIFSVILILETFVVIFVGSVPILLILIILTSGSAIWYE